MSLEDFQAQISLLLNDINRQPEDVRELYEQLHLKINELRGLGQAVPEDLLEFEKQFLADHSLLQAH